VRRTASDRVASRKFGNRADDAQVLSERDRVGKLAFSWLHAVNKGGKGFAVLDGVTLIGVLIAARSIVDRRLHDNGIPAADEIGMETEASGVTSGKGEWLHAIAVGVLVDRVESLEEEVGKTHGEARRAITVIGGSGEGNVILVVGRVQVLSVPALGEVYLHAQSVLAEFGSGGQVGCLRVGLNRQAGIADGTVGDLVCVVGAASEVARGHAETGRESLPLGVGLVSVLAASAEKVINGQTTIRNEGEGTVGPGVVKVGVPVDRVVHLLNRPSGARRGEEPLVDIEAGVCFGGGVETVRTAHSVHVVSNHSGLNERVQPSSEEGLSLAEHLEQGREGRGIAT